MNNLTLGSLFDGSGGFPLGGLLAGITPIWSAEVEPFPIRVTTKRMPFIKHYGDVSAISGAELPPVDIITWGSPCQDLSIAGKRAGLGGSRSGLYVEAVRIVKEMLEATNGEYPKFCVFENVPGLLSSNDGADFYACLDMVQELGFLPDVNILDAQFMGVPQRRKRVFITWVQVDYILRKRMPLSDSITLQLLTELSLMNLAGLLKAYGAELKKSAASVRNQSRDGVRRRMNLFSLQGADRLQMLQRRLDEMQAIRSKDRKSSDSNLGGDQAVKTISTAEDTKSEDSTTENQSQNTELSLKSVLEDGLAIENECITSIWTNETISRKICTYFQILLNTLDVTTALMRSLEKESMSLNCFEWVRYVLTETKECINAARKHEKGAGRLVGDDVLRSYEQEFRAKGERFERYFTENCGREILPEPESLPWNSSPSSIQRQGTAETSQSGIGGSSGREKRIVLNDQGGARMDVSEDVSSTLRAEDHGHPPCVVESAGFCTEHSAGSRGIGYEAKKSPTLRAGVVPAALTLWENHSQDTRYTGPLDTAPTVSSTYGTGGNNQPFVVGDTPKTMKIRAGCEGGGKGILLQEDKSATLACANDQTVFVPKAYRISSFCSNAMLSDNPRAGIYEAETLRTLDCSGGSPTANQGGVAVVEKACSIQGNMIGRDDRNGPQGDGINEDVSFTLNATDHHAVYAMTTGCFTHVEEEKTPTLMARDYKDPTTVAPVLGTEPQYTVRRLTPVECARLQGFPDWWCSDLGTANPSAEETTFWTEVWEIYRKVVTHASKPKTEKQIRKWLAGPYTDSAAYKMWGNGVAEPCVAFVLAGIVYYSQFPAE